MPAVPFDKLGRAAGRIQTQSGSFRGGVVFIKNPDVDPV